MKLLINIGRQSFGVLFTFFNFVRSFPLNLSVSSFLSKSWSRWVTPVGIPYFSVANRRLFHTCWSCSLLIGNPGFFLNLFCCRFSAFPSFSFCYGIAWSLFDFFLFSSDKMVGHKRKIIALDECLTIRPLVRVLRSRTGNWTATFFEVGEYFQGSWSGGASSTDPLERCNFVGCTSGVTGFTSKRSW